MLNFVRFALFVLSTIASAVHASAAFDCTPSATTQCITFDNNTLPSGWALVNNFNNGRNAGISSGGQLYIGQIDTTAGIFQAFNGAGAAKVTVDYDTNVTSNFWGQGNNVVLIPMSCQDETNYGMLRVVVDDRSTLWRDRGR